MVFSSPMTDLKTWGLHWFRRDLRTYGNKALEENRAHTGGKTLGIFCFDSKFLSRTDFSANRFAFFLKTIAALREELQSQGGDLLVVDCLPEEAFSRIFAFAQKNKLPKPSLLTFNRDYEPFARIRDESMEKFLAKEGVPLHTERDHLLFEPHEIVREAGPEGYYRMYSPYARKWINAMTEGEGKERLAEVPSLAGYAAYVKKKRFSLSWERLQALPGFPFKDAHEEFEKKNAKNVAIKIPDAGMKVGIKLLEEFREKLGAYEDKRDIPAAFNTSEFSRFFKNGSLTLPSVLKELKLDRQPNDLTRGCQRFLKELIWREYYYNILFHRPDVERNPFQLKYKNLEWDYNEKNFERWVEGKTGYPIIDAGMRELAATGWINNRVRILVASFLIKDLLLDWRLGENYFMKVLLDGDVAPNNGNWQWVASTGSEAQPYFRVMNPWVQSKKFDPDGNYIRRFVPELKGASAKELHEPSLSRARFGYPAPMVDHDAQKVKAIDRFKKLKS